MLNSSTKVRVYLAWGREEEEDEEEEAKLRREEKRKESFLGESGRKDFPFLSSRSEPSARPPA